jgi:peptidoglycan/LPS O-acetylase OafA/YrhL
VQVFFVVGGFVMARGLSHRGWITVPAAARLVAKRYRRIAGPYLVLLLIAVIANAVADSLMDPASISAAPTLPQLLAHAVFLQDVFGYEPLTAGIWYLAVDFQLGLMLLGLTMLAQRATGDPQVGPATWAALSLLILPAVVASLFWFNRNPAWEEWAVYFVGSYALGVIVEGVLSRRLPAVVFWAYAALIVAALIVEWRLRLAVGLAVGSIILLGGVMGLLSSWPKGRWIESASNGSYSLFLIHFPVCLVMNGILSQFVLHSPMLSAFGMLLAYLLSVAAAVLFYRHVERAFR